MNVREVIIEGEPNPIPVQIGEKSYLIRHRYACIECIGSGKEIYRAINKLSQEEKDKIMSYMLENVGKFKK